MDSHAFRITFFVNPVLCEYCSDYIWGSGYIGYICDKCHKCVHSQCRYFLSNSTECQEANVAISKMTDMLTSMNKKKYVEQNYKIDDLWTVNDVKEWLAVVNLYRYSEVFSKSNINGEKLVKLNVKSLIDMRIHDTYHHDAIFVTIKEAQYRERISYETMKENEKFVYERQQKQLIYSAKDHYFLVATLSTIQECNVCSRPLLGVIHQGLSCQKCGLLIHRQCSYLGLCACKPKVQNRKVIQYYIFGVSLFDVMNEYVEAPAILQKAFQDIEKRAVEFNEDLFDAYRLSTDTKKVEKFKQQLNENGVELIQFQYYDLNTIATIVKAFLRELQNSVIPEEDYKAICRLATRKDNRQEFCNYINTLHPIHLKCLKYVMRHLIRIWQYQHDVKSCNYFPDKLVHIFRTILMRPPWTSIIDVVYNLDLQSLVLKRLLLEYDWEIKPPQYKERPEVPPQPKVLAILTESSPIGEKNSQIVDELMQSEDSKRFNINEMPWYWPDLTRDDTLMLLKDCKEGSYLIRDSSEKYALLNQYPEILDLYPNQIRPNNFLTVNNNNSNNAYYTAMKTLEPQYSIPESANVIAPYTLCLLKGTAIKSIKIFYDLKTKLFDIEVPCRFGNVKQLVDYYTENSLREYNLNLDLKITEGVSKFKFGKTTEWNIERLYASFRDAYRQYESSIRKSEGIEVEIETLYQDLKNKHLANHAFDNIIKLYEGQIDTLKKNLVKFQETSKFTIQNAILSQEDLIIKNIEQLTGRIEELKLKKQELIVDCDYLNTIIQQLQDELEQLRPDLIELRKKRENYQMWLLQRGEDDEKIMKTLKSPTIPEQQMKQFFSTSTESTVSTASSTLTSSQQSPHENSMYWYSANLSREKAEIILKNTPNGTFLVRTSKHKYTRKSNEQTNLNDSISSTSSTNSTNMPTYVLSLMHNNNILHCLIDEDEQGCYIRLNAEYKTNIRKFTTLTNLVVYYSKNSLKNYNPVLDTCLLYPAFLNKPID